MQQLGQLIRQLTGPAGVWTFGLGFIAAALSSMLTIPLGASLTAESVFNIRKSNDNTVITYKDNKAEIKSDEVKQNNAFTTSSDVSTTTLPMGDVADKTEDEFVQKFPRKYFNGIWLAIVFLSVVLMVANAPEIEVILIAQVTF